MKQQRLGFKREKTVISQRNDYDARNAASAKLILETPDQFGGTESGLCQWARTVIARLERERQAAQIDGKI
jgi:hypothetical protein